VRRRGYLKIGSIEGTRPEQPVDSVATILEQDTQATINDWFQRSMANNLFICSRWRRVLIPPACLNCSVILLNRLRDPLPARALVSPGAVAHGLLRRRQGYTAAVLIEESRMLVVSISHALHTNAHRIDFNVRMWPRSIVAMPPGG
jgi:hypothetical protein